MVTSKINDKKLIFGLTDYTSCYSLCLMFNHHNPELYQPLMAELLNVLGSEWADGSYGNDCCASIYLDAPDPTKEEALNIFLPNAIEEDHDQEEINCYYIIRDGETLGEFELGEMDKLLERITELTGK